MKKSLQSPVPLLRPFLFLGVFLASVTGQTYYTEIDDVRLSQINETIGVQSACHCKVICASRPNCRAATYFQFAVVKQCRTTYAADETLATSVDTSSITYFKFDYTRSTVFRSSAKTYDGKTVTLQGICVNDGGTLADVTTQKDKYAAMDLISDWTWVSATDANNDGKFEWSDGSPMVGTVFQASDLRGSGPRVGLNQDGTLEFAGQTTTWSYYVLCRK